MKKLIITLFLFSTTLMADDFTFDKATGKTLPTYVAEIKIFKGKVFKVSKGKTSAVQNGTRFFKDDSIKTDDKSFAKLIVVDDTIMSLGSNSELNFAEFQFRDKGDRNIVFNFVKGQLSGHIKNKAKDGQITVKTQNAIMGIRGTEILVNYQTIGKIDVSQFALLSGSALVTDDKKQKQDLNKAGKITFVTDPKTKDGANDKTEMTKEEYDHLFAESKNELTDFKPFMPLFDPDKADKKSNIYAFLHKQTNRDGSVKEVDDKTDAPSDDEEENSKSWRHNLKKLNQHLKENQKTE